MPLDTRQYGVAAAGTEPRPRTKTAFGARHRGVAALLGPALVFALNLAARADSETKAVECPPVPAQQVGLDPDKDALPAAGEPSDEESRRLRELRTTRYNSKYGMKLAPGQEHGCLDEPPPVPKLPVNQSEAVASVRVVSFQPYLSSDGTDLFTEYSLCVERVFKRKTGVPVSTGQVIILERHGGRLRLPSGEMLSKRCIDIGRSPRPGGRYLVFLDFNSSTQDFDLVTGYELSDGRALRLTAPAGTRHVTEAALIQQLRTLLKKH